MSASLHKNVLGDSNDIPEIFKALLEYPFSAPVLDDNEKDKDKLCEPSDGDSGEGGVSGGMGPSAALTPAIWDKTIPYDGETFHLEYMDLDEFLLENGIPASMEEELQKSLSKDGPAQAEAKAPPTSSSSPAPAKEPPVTRTALTTVSLLPIVQLEQEEEELVTVTVSESGDGARAAGSAEESPKRECVTPTPIDPDEIEVDVNFEPDPTDLVLSSVPGGELFNPRKHRFSEDELKPQPMIKKAKKVFVPNEQKDEKYWQRRRKNNVAAKRSRDARRLKENQITVRAAFLERENTALRQEVAELRRDYGRCKNVLVRYEDKYGPLAPIQTEEDDL
ncbi:TEF transcription factor, PAR bZIP family member a isoform X4 [Anguilla rostrata]|uniref:TEF transcription factor, PAR bZIP family member a isoform X2 n=2 Tax=Anguilla anguilla TaxID=7936 RepID=UPI0015AEEA77|nr:TEF transcription factor, PAR bZIP family member a isoform X2 [Anguilla anguilla]